MRRTSEIIKVASGIASEETRESIFREIAIDTDVKKEYIRYKNLAALITTQQNIDDYELEKKYLKLRKRTQSDQKTTLIWKNFSKYAAVFIIGIVLTVASVKFLGIKFPDSQIPLAETRIITNYGQQSNVILADSTVVFLNYGTEITYDSKFGVDNRNIRLKGQAYFHVKRNEEIPLVVDCNQIKVKVLGTKFDASAYENSNSIKIFLESGSVSLLNSKDELITNELAAGEVAKYDLIAKKIVINKTDPTRYYSWKNGFISFTDSSMKEVFDELERKFNVQIEVRNQAVFESVFTATITNETIDEIFKSIEYSCSLKYKIMKSKSTQNKTKIIVY